jgi:predicted transcriptional regulator
MAEEIGAIREKADGSRAHTVDGKDAMESAAEIVSAYISNNSVRGGGLPALFEQAAHGRFALRKLLCVVCSSMPAINGFERRL